MVPLSPLQMEVNTHFPHAQKLRVSHLDSVGNMNDFVTEEGLVVQILNTRSCFGSLAGFSVAHGSTCNYCLSYKVIQQIKNHHQCRSIIFKKAFGTTGVDLMIICLSSLYWCTLALFIDLNTNYRVCILCVSYCHTPFGSLSYVPAVGFTTQQAAAAVDPMQHILVWITRVSLALFTHTHTKRIMG